MCVCWWRGAGRVTSLQCYIVPSCGYEQTCTDNSTLRTFSISSFDERLRNISANGECYKYVRNI